MISFTVEKKLLAGPTHYYIIMVAAQKKVVGGESGLARRHLPSPTLSERRLARTFLQPLFPLEF